LPIEYPKRVGDFGTKNVVHNLKHTSPESCMKIKDILKQNKIKYCGDDVLIKATTVVEGKTYEAALKGEFSGKTQSKQKPEITWMSVYILHFSM
jgi:hypothetical protein